MKNKRIIVLLITTNFILIAILCSFIRINGNIIKEKQIIKEMSESTQVTDLNNQINALNAEHTEYMNYVQTCKAQLASTITNMGIETSENADIDTITNNISHLKGYEDIIAIADSKGQGQAKCISSYTVPEEYYGKNAIIIMSTGTPDNNENTFSSSKTGFTTTRTLVSRSLQSASTGNYIVYRSYAYEGILKEGTISCSLSGFDRRCTTLIIVIF